MQFKSQKFIFVRPTAGPLRGGRKVPFLTTRKFSCAVLVCVECQAHKHYTH